MPNVTDTALFKTPKQHTNSPYSSRETWSNYVCYKRDKVTIWNALGNCITLRMRQGAYWRKTVTEDEVSVTDKKLCDNSLNSNTLQGSHSTHFKLLTAQKIWSPHNGHITRGHARHVSTFCYPGQVPHQIFQSSVNSINNPFHSIYFLN